MHGRLKKAAAVFLAAVMMVPATGVSAFAEGTEGGSETLTQEETTFAVTGTASVTDTTLTASNFDLKNAYVTKQADGSYILRWTIAEKRNIAAIGSKDDVMNNKVTWYLGTKTNDGYTFTAPLASLDTATTIYYTGDGFDESASRLANKAWDETTVTVSKADSSQSSITALTAADLSSEYIQISKVTVYDSKNNVRTVDAQNPLSVERGKTEQLTLAVEPENATRRNEVNISVPNFHGRTVIASIDENGLITGQAVGGPVIVTITVGGAQSALGLVGGAKASFNLKVVEPTVTVNSITLDKTEADLKVGDDPLTLTATVDPAEHETALAWTSSNPNVATVAAGEGDTASVTQVEEGTTTITATLGDKSATCTVNVTREKATEAAQNVTALIGALPDASAVTESDRNAVVAAEKAYIELDDDDEKWVSDEDKAKLQADVNALPKVMPAAGEYSFSQTILNEEHHNYSTVERIKTSSSDSMMFRPVAPTTLTVDADGNATAVFTLSGSGNVAVYLGSTSDAKAAESAAGDDYTKISGIILPLDADAKQYQFKIPVTSLEVPVEIAVRGGSGKWNDRAFIFHTSNMTQTAAPTPEPAATPAQQNAESVNTAEQQAVLQAQLLKVKKFKVRTSANTVRMTWKKTKGADGYQIQYKLKKAKKYRTLKTIRKGKTKKYTTSKLKRGKKYVVRIRPYKVVNGQKVYGKWTKKTVTVK